MLVYDKQFNGRIIRRKKPVEKRAGRWKYAVRRDSIELFELRNWKAATRMRDSWRNGIRETMARQAEEEEEE
jgi:hypothetical protein